MCSHAADDYKSYFLPIQPINQQLLHTSTSHQIIPGVVGGGTLFVPLATEKPTNVLIYFHGGGFALGSVDGYASVTSHLAAASGAAVLSVEYRLAPEHKAPAAAADALAAFRFVCSGVGKGTSSAAAAALRLCR